MHVGKREEEFEWPHVRASKHDDEWLARVESSESNSTHDSLSPAHVERNFIFARDLLEKLNVSQQKWMHWPKNTPKPLDLFPALQARANGCVLVRPCEITST